MPEDISTEIADLEGQMADTRSWFHNEAAQHRYGELIAVRDGGNDGRVGGTVPDTRMRDLIQSEGYWKDPAKQAEVRALVEGVATIEPPFKVETLFPVSEIAESLQIEPAEAEAFQGAWDALAADMGDTAQEASETFSGLPDRVQAVAMRELVADVKAEDFPAAELADFAKTVVGKIVVPAWGSDAAGKVGKAMARWSRLAANLSESEAGEFEFFYTNALDASQKAAVVRALAR